MHALFRSARPVAPALRPLARSFALINKGVDGESTRPSPTPQPAPKSSPAPDFRPFQSTETVEKLDASFSSLNTAAASDPEPVEPASYSGIASAPFSQEISNILLAPIVESDVEIKPDGTLYLPEIKYRRILNRSFGPGGWAMKPVSPARMVDSTLMRSYQLFALGRFVAEVTGEQTVQRGMTRATAEESAKSNAVMRCCKDLGIASELWDPIFIARWKSKHAVAVWAKNARSGEKRVLWRKQVEGSTLAYPWVEEGFAQ